jgi:hypothetical protein
MEDLIEGCAFHMMDTHITCVMKLKTGFKIVGDSSPILDANFNEEIGKQVAFEKAFKKLEEFEAYHAKRVAHG